MTINEETDAEIVRRSHQTPAAFASLFDRHAPTIHRFAARRVGDSLADDLMSATFLAAFERRASFDLERENALPWLYGIVTHLLSRHARTEERRWRAYARTAHLGPDPGTDDADRLVARMDASGMRGDLARYLADLSPGDRDVLLLYGFADLTYEEIAVALGVPIGTVRSRLHRARRQMRQALELPPAAEVVKESRHA